MRVLFFPTNQIVENYAEIKSVPNAYSRTTCGACKQSTIKPSTIGTCNICGKEIYDIEKCFYCSDMYCECNIQN